MADHQLISYTSSKEVADVMIDGLSKKYGVIAKTISDGEGYDILFDPAVQLHEVSTIKKYYMGEFCAGVAFAMERK